jgi:beta-phosphoglucomutase-like phosphatase (HAD superfamily)
MEGIDDLIDVCQERVIKLALASSSVREQVDAILENLTLNSENKTDYRSVFATTVSGDQVAHKKPAPDIYESVLAVLNFDAGNCLAIEDSGAGIQSAQASQLFCIALKNQFLKRSEMQKAEMVVESIMEIVKKLRV